VRLRKRVDQLEYEVACLQYDVRRLLEVVEGPRMDPPPIVVDPRLTADRPQRKTRRGE
jgi:hypothetical protein